MPLKKYLIIIFTLFILVSCNSNQVKPDSETSTERDIVTPDNGLLIASVTRGMKEGSILTKKDIDANFKILKVSEIAKLKEEKGKLFAYDNSVTISSHDYKFLGQNNELEEYGVDGRLTVTKLTPGEYAVVNWVLGVPSGYDYRHLSPEEFTYQYFTITANEATYIGSLHLETLYGKNIFGITIEGGAESKCTDMSIRDLNIFKEKYNAYNSWLISTQLIEC